MEAAVCSPQLLGRVVLCADHYDDRNISGQFYHISLENPLPFTGITELMRNMEDVFDQCSYPQAYFSNRSFSAQSEMGKSQSFPARRGSQQMDEDILKTARGEKATFVVQVQFRQSATWQGTISWTEGKKTRRFRSALEMLKLIDDALASQTEQEQVDWND